MSDQSLDQAATRARVLDAATQVFADVGFQSATVRDICSLAGVNVASVNYHFGDKLGLYAEVLKQCSGVESQARIRAAIAACHAPADQLRVFVRGMLQKMLGEAEQGWNMRIMAREIANPTAALGSVVELMVRPQFDQLCELFARVLDRRPSEKAVRMCVFSLIGQILYYVHARPVVARLWPELQMTPAQMDELTEHIVGFTLAGLGVNKRIKSKRKGTDE